MGITTGMKVHSSKLDAPQHWEDGPWTGPQIVVKIGDEYGVFWRRGVWWMVRDPMSRAELKAWTGESDRPSFATPEMNDWLTQQLAMRHEPDRIIPPMRLDELERICDEARRGGA